jgi:hypothetical protein
MNGGELTPFEPLPEPPVEYRKMRRDADIADGRPAQEAAERQKNIVVASATSIAKSHRVAAFRGRPMVLEEEPYPHFVPLHKDRFERLAYPLLGGVTRSRINDVFAYLSNTAEDLTDYDRYILFGLGTGLNAHPDAITTVWDMERLEMTQSIHADQTIWRSPYAPVPTHNKPVEFIMQLAGNDEGLYSDIMQSLAPLIMSKKPDGVIWWVGDGANGKSTLMDAIYKIFPGQLSSITVKRLVDGRDTPSLNGTLANVVKESSEGRIEDTEIYKSIGTHENFRVHKFHSQDDIEVRGDVHHIFSANSVPTFNDKGYSARRRTFIIPFGQRFTSDPTFEERTFTPEFFGHLIVEMGRYAKLIEEQGYKYRWSAATLSAKADYDSEANNAEDYAKHIINEGVVAFESFHPIKQDYENWCADMGYVPLGIGNLRKAMTALGFERMTHREGDRMTKIYRLPDAGTNLSPLSASRPGLFTTPGFIPEPLPDEKTVVPAFNEVDPEPVVEQPVKRKSVLKGEW